MSSRLKPGERRERIAAIVREASRASVDELAERLDISRETVRRDLALLSEQGRAPQGARRRGPLPDGAREPARRPPRGRPAGEDRDRRRGGGAVPAWRQPARSTPGARPPSSPRRSARSAASPSSPTRSLVAARAAGTRRTRATSICSAAAIVGDGHEMLGPLDVEQIQRAAGRSRGADDRRHGRGRQLHGFQRRGGLRRARHDRQRPRGRRSSPIRPSSAGTRCSRSASVGKIDRLVTDQPPPQPLGEALRACGVEVVISRRQTGVQVA